MAAGGRSIACFAAVLLAAALLLSAPTTTGSALRLLRFSSSVSLRLSRSRADY
jgi:hypothetical protein